MMHADLGMAFLLAVMGGMNGWNCITLFRDKRVAGISPTTMLFRGGANAYQAYFLFTLGQWLSFSIAVPATALSLAWVVQAFYYHRWPGGIAVGASPIVRNTPASAAPRITTNPTNVILGSST